MGQARSAQRGGGGSRRIGLLLGLLAVLLGGGSFFLSQSYLAGEAGRANPPLRPVAVAAKAIAAGAIVGPADARTASMPVVPDLADLYLQPGAVSGIAVRALREGQPILVGDLLPAESAGSVAPLVPLKVKVGDQQRDVAGGLNLPLDRLAAPPPKVRVHDRVDLWASSAQQNVPSLQLVLENVEIIAFNGASDAPAPTGFVVAVTVEQLDRYLFFTNTPSQLVITVRSSRTQ